MNSPEIKLLPHHRIVVDRFVEVCRADARIVAAVVYGSYARGAADAYSDLDLGLFTTDAGYADVFAGREAFMRQLGEPVFLETFGLPFTLFYIFANGAEGEMLFGREGQFNHDHDGPYHVLLDKKNILAGAVFPRDRPAPAEQFEMLRRQVYWFWHEASHFITALGRGQLWWAYGQLEALRLICVRLVRLDQNFADDGADEAYFKVEKAISVERLAPLQTTFCPMEPGALLEAVNVVVRFYCELAPRLAHEHGLAYPAGLERVMTDRLKKLGAHARP